MVIYHKAILLVINTNTIFYYKKGQLITSVEESYTVYNIPRFMFSKPKYQYTILLLN